MGLMDRDYYREKKGAKSTENLFEKLRKNPVAVIAIILAILFLIALIT